MKQFLSEKTLFVLVSCVILGFSAVPLQSVRAQDAPAEESEEQREAREEAEKEAKEEEEKKEQEEDLKKDAQKLESKLDKAEQEKQEKQQVLNAQYNDLTKQRYALEKTKAEIDAKDAEIEAKDAEIVTLTGQVELNRVSLRTAMRQLYFERSYSVASQVYTADQGGQFLLAQDQIDQLREKMVATMQDLESQRVQLDGVREQLADAKQTKEELLSEQETQEADIAKSAAATSVQVKEVEATISEINGKLAGIQSKLSDLLGVGLSTDDIVEAAEFASAKTGVRKGFLLGMLIVETDLGRFTGGCSYKESRMNDHRKDLFKKLTKELDYDYKKMKVSCPPSNYKGTGGAMGVAQFMSDTWYGYKDVIAKRTGHNPPDPWDLVDGVMAMASKLANDGATKNGKDGEWKAAARYLGSCSGNTKFYCENVIYWADNYEKKL